MLATAICLLSGFLHAQTTNPQLYSHGDPTSEEQYLLGKLNRARMDPVGEGQRLAAWLRLPENSGTVNLYQINPDQIAADFAALPAVPPLAFDAALIASARRYSQDTADHNGQYSPDGPHIGWDGSTPDQRVNEAGFRNATGNDGYAGECSGPGLSSLDIYHSAWMVDWGVPSLGHRKLAMQGADFDVYAVGIGVAHIAASVAPLANVVATQDYGEAGFHSSSVKPYLRTAEFPAYLVGVVYHDANGNGQYDVGEGVVGATVTLDDGAYYTVTSASGGYALPLVHSDGSNADGNVRVQMTGLPNGEIQVSTLSIGTVQTSYGPYRANLKWDVQTGLLPVSDPAHASISGGGVDLAKGNKIKLRVSRPANQTDLSQSLSIAYTIKGSAVAGIDYLALPGSVTIPIGKRHAKIVVQALDIHVLNRPPGPWKLQLKLKGVPGTQGKTSVGFGQ